MQFRLSFVCLALLLCCAATGCGGGYPYYTLGGSPESRVVEIHLSDSETFEVHTGTGIGGGLTAEHKAALALGQDVTVEKGPAKVTVTPKGPAIIVNKVEYDGKEVFFHEPIL